MRKAVIVVALVLAGLMVVYELTFACICDGYFPLQVEVVSDGDPPERVSCQVHGDQRGAEWASQQPQLYGDIERVTVAAPFEGRPLEVRVECSYHLSPLGRKTNWSQFGYLVVVAEWDDGRRVAKVAPIPDGQTTRTLRVELP